MIKDMATIAENLQTIKSSTDDIKQAIIDKGGTISGDMTTWADAISGIETGGGSDNLKIFSFNNGGAFGSGTRVYIDGMTWGEWIDSIYNTLDTFGGFMKGGSTGPIYCSLGSLYNGGAQVFASQLISNSITYVIYTSGGSGS